MRAAQAYSSTSRRRVPLPPNWGAIRAFVLQRDPICRWGSIEEDMANPGLCPNRSTDADHIGDPNDHSPAGRCVGVRKIIVLLMLASKVQLARLR